MTGEIPLELPLSVQHFHMLFVRIPQYFRCAHGVHLTHVERRGVRIQCPESCWLVRWDRWPNA
jgi:hypothetical protein